VQRELPNHCLRRMACFGSWAARPYDGVGRYVGLESVLFHSQFDPVVSPGPAQIIVPPAMRLSQPS
jgi:hypothetical protein